MDRTVDVVIIGGGPAGMSTALHLIRRDPSWKDRLVVLEKETHPRHKLCAGGLTPFALNQLNLLGLCLDIPFIPVNNARLEYGNRAAVIRGQPAIAVTRRPEFDAWLARQSKARGVRLLEDTPVREIVRDADGIQVKTDTDTFRARAIVGADGSKGLVRRWLGAREPRPRVARLLEVVTPANGSEPEFRNGVARFDFGALRDALQGYYWDFPSLVSGVPHMNRGVYDGRVSPERPRADLPKILQQTARAKGIAPEDLRIEGHPIHWFSPTNLFSGDRVVLAGDTAGADPLFGEGIGVALGYGQVAAAALDHALRRNDWSFSHHRTRLLVSPVGRYLLVRWFAASVVYRVSHNHVMMLGLWLGLKGLSWLISPVPHAEGVLPRRAGLP
jgi:flavin-dependent dehydrogenase